jgi:hypothetical protein
VNGWETEQNFSLAKEFADRGCADKDPLACGVLAGFYAQGIGVPRIEIVTRADARAPPRPTAPVETSSAASGAANAISPAGTAAPARMTAIIRRAS